MPIASDDADEPGVAHFWRDGVFAGVGDGERGDLWDVVQTSDLTLGGLEMQRYCNIHKCGKCELWRGGTNDEMLRCLTQIPATTPNI